MSFYPLTGAYVCGGLDSQTCELGTHPLGDCKRAQGFRGSSRTSQRLAAALLLIVLVCGCISSGGVVDDIPTVGADKLAADTVDDSVEVFVPELEVFEGENSIKRIRTKKESR